MTPRIENRTRKTTLALAALLIAVFLAIAPPAKAQTVNDPNATSIASLGFFKDLTQFAQIFNGLSTIFGFFGDIMNFVFPNGFGGLTAAINAQTNVRGALTGDLADYNAGSNQYIMGQGLAAQHQANATMPMNASGCGMQQYMRGMRQMTDALDALKAALMRDVYGVECTGTGATCSGPARAWEQTQDLCKLGFMSTVSNGDLPAKLGCAGPPGGDNDYIDRDTRSFTDILQMPIATPCVLGDGHLSFSGVAPPGGCLAGAAALPGYLADPTKSQVAWVGALKFCEGLRSEAQPTVFIVGRQPSSADIAAFQKARVTRTASNSNLEACVDALVKRTAVPMTSNTAAQAYTGPSATTDLATFQNNVCKYMHDDPNTGGASDIPGMQGGAPVFPANTGLGITGDPTLNDCIANQTGISYWMAKRILSDRCLDSNWLTNIMPTLVHDTHEGEMHAAFGCRKEQAMFKEELDTEAKQMRQFVSRSAQLAREDNAPVQSPDQQQLQQVPSSQSGRGAGVGTK